MCAAVSDYKPKIVFDKKIKKQDKDLNIELERSVDILESLGKVKTSQILVGFAAEDTNHIENGNSKLKRKNLDYIVINDLSAFDTNDNQVDVIDKYSNIKHIKSNKKNIIAKEIINLIKTTR